MKQSAQESLRPALFLETQVFCRSPQSQQENLFEVYVSQAPLTQRRYANGYDEHIQSGEIHPAHTNRR
jgi:hypothetical protein